MIFHIANFATNSVLFRDGEGTHKI